MPDREAHPADHRRPVASRTRVAFPALHRLERKGWITAKWDTAGKDLKREFKYYRLTPAGRKQLVAEESKWKKLTGAVARIMWPAEES
jgi:PadR family transcriptional regulator, regulatory protein PadR